MLIFVPSTPRVWLKDVLSTLDVLYLVISTNTDAVFFCPTVAPFGTTQSAVVFVWYFQNAVFVKVKKRRVLTSSGLTLLVTSYDEVNLVTASSCPSVL